MSQSRFSIVLVGVSALLRRPLVSRLRSAAFTARGSGGFRRWASPSVSAFAAGRVDLRAHDFRFSACAASGLPSSGWFFCLPLRRLPLGGLAFGLTASAFRHAPLRGCRSAGWFCRLPFRRLPLGGLAFGLTASGLPLGGLALPPSASGLPLGGLTFGLTASAFWHAPLRSCRSAGWPSDSPLPLFGTHRFGVALGELVLLPSASEMAARRVGLRVHDFRFSACTASGLPSASWFFRLPFRRLPLGGLTFGLTASAFRHAPIRTAAPPT